MIQRFLFNRRTFLSNKKESRERDSPPAAGRFGDIMPYRRSAILRGAVFI